MSHNLGIKEYGDESWVFKSKKYSLFSGKVANNFKIFREDGTLCDVDLISGDTVVKAHRVVLAAACIYFETMFKSGSEESVSKRVSLLSVSPDVLPLIVDFIYTGQTVICGSTVQHLVDAANMMQLDELSSGCVEYLRRQLRPSNVLGTIRLAETYDLMQLAEEALGYAQKNWKSVVEGEEFLNVPMPLLMKLLSSDNLAIDDEVQVLQAALIWLDHDPASRKQHCVEILQQVRLRKVSPQEFENELANVRDPAITEILHLFKGVLAAVNREARLDTRNYMYVIGGSNYAADSNTVFRFDGKIWKRMTPMNVTRRALGVAVMRGRIYAVGGQDAELRSGEVYDPSADTWTPIAPMRRARYGSALAAVDDKLYAFGGDDQSSIEAYDPATDEWTVVGHMPEYRTGMSIVTYGGAVYVVGGQTVASSLTNDVLRYAPAQAEWRRMRPLLPGRDDGCTYGAGAVVYGRHLYVVGGLKERDASVSIVRAYNLETEESHLVTEMSTPRVWCSVGVLNGTLVVAGGGVTSVEMYDLGRAEWSTGPPLPESINFAATAVL